MRSRISAARSGARPGRRDDRFVGARGVDDQRGRAERLVERAAGDVDMLDPDKRDDRVGVEQPAADHLQQGRIRR